VFADYTVRDAILIESMKDEEFAFVLLNKIANTVHKNYEDGKPTQDDIEALATSSQICVMWEQFQNAYMITKVIETYAEEHDLIEPPLTKITKQLLQAHDTFPFAKVRTETIAELKTKSDADLEKEETND